jgi:Uma2 family endonuclease
MVRRTGNHVVNGGNGKTLLRAAAEGKAQIVRFSLDQYHTMIKDGIVPEDSTVELLYGMLVRKDRSVLGEDPMGHSPLHAAVVGLLTALTAKINGPKRYLQIQLPISIAPDHEPEPDGAVILGEIRDFLNRLPGPSDVACVIEVAHSSLERDEEDKGPIYASAGIGQYLIIDLRAMRVLEMTEPNPGNGKYAKSGVFEKGDIIRVNLGNGEFLRVDVTELLP